MRMKQEVSDQRVGGATFPATSCSSRTAVLVAYLGKGDEFDRAISDLSLRYSEQNEHDHSAFAAAVRSGRLEAVEGV
jgi:hypothetical protein